MAVISPRKPSASFDELYAANVAGFRRYLRGRLSSEGSPVIDPEDALQEAMADAFARWQEVESAPPGERERRLYRLVRDAASEALRKEYGRRDRPQRPGTVLFDFGSLDSDDEDLEPRDRDLTVTILGQLARDLAESVEDQVERRVLLDRAILLAGLRALTEREIVVLVAVERRGWDQVALARELDLSVEQVYASLFMARKLFYGLLRHAVGIEVDEEERASLHAFLDGTLRGRDKRLTSRHIRHCQACQALIRQEKGFTERAHHVLSPLPFLLAAGALTGKVIKSTTAAAGAGAASATNAAAGATRGLLSQAGAAKALAATFAILGVGVGVAGWLSIEKAPRPAVGDAPVAAGASSTLNVASPGPALRKPAASKKAKPSSTRKKSHLKRKKKKSNTTGAGASTPLSDTGAPSSENNTPTSGDTSSSGDQTPPASSDTGGGASDNGGGESSSGGGSSQGEFFGG